MMFGGHAEFSSGVMLNSVSSLDTAFVIPESDFFPLSSADLFGPPLFFHVMKYI